MPITLDGTSGITTPGLTNTGTETIVNLTTTGNTILGDASTDTLNVGNGGLIKDASGNLLVNTSTAVTYIIANDGAMASVPKLEVASTDANAAASIIRYSNDATGSNLFIGKSRGTTANSKTVVQAGDQLGSLSFFGTDSDEFQTASSIASFVNTASNNAVSADLRFYTTPTGAYVGVERMRLDASGNLLVGTTSSLYTYAGRGIVEINGSSESWLGLNIGGTTASFIRAEVNDLNIINTRAGNTIFSTSNTERVRIDASGNLFIGSTAVQVNTTRLQVEATGVSYAGVFINNNSGYQTITCWNKATSGTVYFVEFGSGTSYNSRGSITYNGTVVAYNATSDYRLKNTIAPMTGALDKVALLKPCTYKWNSNGVDGEGFIAHELAEVFPNAVAGEKDAVDDSGNPKYQGIDTSFLVATLTAAIQEQQAMIDELKAKVAALEAA
jgi:hypothetical protein